MTEDGKDVVRAFAMTVTFMIVLPACVYVAWWILPLYLLLIALGWLFSEVVSELFWKGVEDKGLDLRFSEGELFYTPLTLTCRIECCKVGATIVFPALLEWIVRKWILVTNTAVLVIAGGWLPYRLLSDWVAGSSFTLGSGWFFTAILLNFLFAFGIAPLLIVVGTQVLEDTRLSRCYLRHLGLTMSEGEAWSITSHVYLLGMFAFL